MARPRSKLNDTDRPAISGDGTFQVRALAKGLAILGLFDAENRELALDEIASRSGLPRMTAYRMIRTMESVDYLVRDAATSRYHLGPALLAATYLSESYSELQKIARPYLRELAEATGESATLAVEVDGVAVSVDTVDTTRPFRREVALGRIIGDTANAMGKIFTAFKPEAEKAEIIARKRAQLTPFTITNPAELGAQLEQVARDGVAFDIEERNIGTCAVAAPVRDQLGRIIASIAVVVPTGRFAPADRPRFAEAVKDTAATLSAFLGYSSREEQP